MDQRVSVVTLGVRDLDRAVAFYQAVGWEPAASPEGVVFFQAGGLVVALWDRAALEVDSCAEDSGGWGGVTLAYNVNSREEVDDVLDEAEAAGATIGRRGGGTFWGGYSGVFTDPEGHPWEVAHNPFWSVTEDGQTMLGDGRG
ncbi:VOC family protein [Ornithinimicrobium sp. F0845]|uniref:VOC family protein n=1 Tax=Ornithinimicrobium sp. F0845 TaxID=2926412 RepID=UPI001FF6D4D0|nr:VOC family protein [Ornithinimicrobium sp. F0845]MCK0112285.1 VOC family protein [Ornithinimicrobium sp. F0845]